MPLPVAFVLVLIILINIIPGLYLRYIPFLALISQQQKSTLKISYLICLAIEFILIVFLLTTKIIPLEFYSFKFLIGVLWIPLFVINLLVIPGLAPQHIFVLGLQMVYTFLLHSIVIFSYSFFLSENQIILTIFIQCFLYLLLFGLTFQFIKPFFQNIFITRHVDNYYWKQICLLPILLFSSTYYFTIIEHDVVIYEQFPARVIMGLCAFIICYCMTLDLQWLRERIDLSHLEQLHTLQINSFKKQSQLLHDSQEALSIERHDMRHHIRLLYSLIKDDHKSESLAYLEGLENDLQKTVAQKYCQNLLLNAILAFYIPMAEQKSIFFQRKIAVPEHIPFDEPGLATVLSNLLENAITASLKQPKERRKIQLTLTLEKNRLKLLVKNQFDQPVILGKDSLPITNEQGHGLGMKSLLAFVNKNKGIVLCRHEDGWFSISVIINA